MAEKEKNEVAVNRNVTEIQKLDVYDAYFLEKMGMTKEQMGLLQNWYPGITAPEIMYATEFQREYGLSIMKKEIHLVKRAGYKTVDGKKTWLETYEPMVGIDGSRAAARNNSKLLGIEYMPAETGCDVKDVPVLENGVWVKKPDLVAWAEIDLGNGRKTRLEVNYSAVCQKVTDKDTNTSRPTKFWANDPLGMTQKVAEHRLNKKVYGLYLDFAESAEISYNEDGTGLSAEKKSSDHLKLISEAVKEVKATEVIEHEVVSESKDDDGKPPFDADPETGEIAMTEFEQYIAKNGITSENLVDYYSDTKSKTVAFEDLNKSEDYAEFRKFVMSKKGLEKIQNYKISFNK